jgi:UDP-N-acetylmuramoyl-L-alanyl-D-glutamate--2,6-diaminopimelate ligase
MKSLSEVLAEAGVQPDEVSGDGRISGIFSDSRKLKVGGLFVCMPSGNRDTHEFLPEIAHNGAGAALTHTDGGHEWAVSLGLSSILIRNEGLAFTEALWRLAKVLSGDPSAKMRVLGVTGTNGKTTTTWLIRDALIAMGRKASYLGTLGIQTPLDERELSNTTPFAVELNELLCEALAAGSQDLAMEVSSHALQERRSDGVEFDAAVFTNLTQDHLDFHGTMEEYARAKFRLFTELPEQSSKSFTAAINSDDPTGAAWIPRLQVPCIAFGLQSGELRGKPLEVKVDGLRMELVFRGAKAELTSRLGGSYNVENCLSALGGLLAVGYGLEESAQALSKARPVPGRFEAVPNDRGIGILVDYAHTPDALEKLLAAVRPLASGKVIVVFGCGGDRDRSKRPKMARAVSSHAELSIVTSDNPRTEDPFAIVREVEAGIVPGALSLTIVDRREAVAHAVSQAVPGDVVVIAGKGHENYQIIGRTKHPMDDRELAREALKRMELR